MKSELDYAMDRAVAHDDALDRRRALRAAGKKPADDRQCVMLQSYETRCDQCARKTQRPHLAAGREFCARCCPACAARFARELLLAARASVPRSEFDGRLGAAPRRL